MTIPDTGGNPYQPLIDRIGEPHFRQRFTLQVNHATRIFDQGRTLIHIENMEWLMVFIYYGLKVVGMYGWGNRNFKNVQIVENTVYLRNLPKAFDGYRILHLSDLHLARAAIPSKHCSILLAHSPESYRAAASIGYDLMLSGHTHAGQICLPGRYAILANANCPRRMLYGTWKYQMMQGYTSSGTGSCGVPVRFFCPPEIVIHTLRLQL